MARLKQILSFILRLLITCAFLIYIFRTVITFDDYLILRDGSKVHGRIIEYSTKGVYINVSDRQLWYPSSSIADRKNIDSAYTQRDIDYKEIHLGFFAVWKQLNVTVFCLFSTLFFVNLLLCAIRLKCLLRAQGMVVNIGKLFKINLLGAFFSNFLPGFTGGDLARAYYMARDSDQKTQAIISIVMDRVIGLSALVFLSASVLIFHLKKEEFFIPSLVIFTCLMGITVGILAIFYIPESWFLHSDRAIIKVIAVFCHYRHSPRLLLSSCAISILVHISTNLSMFGFAHALGIYHVPWFVFFIYIPVGLLFMSLPISISGLGVGEATFAFLFSKVGVASGKGFFLCLLLRLAEMEMGMIGGILWILGKKR